VIILRIIFPTDLEHVSALSLSLSLSLARALANEHNAQVIFLHVLHLRGLPVDYPDEEDIDDERCVDAIDRMNRSHGLPDEGRPP
jgi:hypothetical protein